MRTQYSQILACAQLKADLFSQTSKWSYLSVQITAYKDLWRACTFSPSSTPLKAPKGPPYTNLLVLHRRFTAQLETLQPRKSEGCIFVDGKGEHDLASLDIDGSIVLLWSIGALEAENETKSREFQNFPNEFSSHCTSWAWDHLLYLFQKIRIDLKSMMMTSRGVAMLVRWPSKEP